MPRYPIELAKKLIAKSVTKVVQDWEWTLIERRAPTREEKLLRLDFYTGGNSEAESISKCKQQAVMFCE